MNYNSIREPSYKLFGSISPIISTIKKQEERLINLKKKNKKKKKDTRKSKNKSSDQFPTQKAYENIKLILDMC